jgi:membrane-associated phospholipid phosphatase
MDLIHEVRPVDRVVSAFNLGLAAVWLGQMGRAPYAELLVVAHVAGAFLPALIARLRPDAGAPMRVLRELYPLIFVTGVWAELGLVRLALHHSAHDPLIAAADRALFGGHPHAAWMPAMPDTWFSEIMFFSYFAYYGVVFLSPVGLLLLKRRDAMRDVVFGLTTAYLACYASYVLFPVDGPSHTMVRYAGDLTNGLFYRLTRSPVSAWVDPMGTAFPSSHVVGAVSMAVLAARWFSKPVALLYAVEALGVVLSTVYTQAHFAIDSAAGVLVALLCQCALAPALDARLRRQRAAVIVPPLPVWTGRSATEPITGGGT